VCKKKICFQKTSKSKFFNEQKKRLHTFGPTNCLNQIKKRRRKIPGWFQDIIEENKTYNTNFLSSFCSKASLGQCNLLGFCTVKALFHWNKFYTALWAFAVREEQESLLICLFIAAMFFISTPFL